MNVGIGSDAGIGSAARGGGSWKKFIDTDECLYLWPRRCDGLAGEAPLDDGDTIVGWKLNGFGGASRAGDDERGGGMSPLKGLGGRNCVAFVQGDGGGCMGVVPPAPELPLPYQLDRLDRIGGDGVRDRDVSCIDGGASTGVPSVISGTPSYEVASLGAAAAFGDAVAAAAIPALPPLSLLAVGPKMIPSGRSLPAHELPRRCPVFLCGTGMPTAVSLWPNMLV